MFLTTAKAQRQAVALAATLVALPAILFYAIACYFAVNIPLYDDYDAGLDFLNRTTQIPSFLGRLSYLLAAQQNEYKIVFGHAVLWLQYALFGTINFTLTSAAGNLLVLATGWLLWKMFLPREIDLSRRLLLFIPVSLLLFQLNFAETLNWPLPALQNLGILFFALATLNLLVQSTLASFCGAIAMLILAIFTSGNGFLLVPVGILVLLVNRRYLRIAWWLAATALCLAGYAYHYNSQASQSPVHHSTLDTILHIRPLFVVPFIGSAAFRPVMASVLLGLAILGYLAYLVRVGYWRRNPLVSYCLLFLLLTAVGVAGIRSDLGMETAVSSRYRIYCDMLLVFCWFSIAEEFLQDRVVPLRSNRLYRAALAVCVLFSAYGDVAGTRLLHQRSRDRIAGMILFEHPQPLQPPGPVLPVANQSHAMDVFDVRAKVILLRSEQLGVYHPPAY